MNPDFYSYVEGLFFCNLLSNGKAAPQGNGFCLKINSQIVLFLYKPKAALYAILGAYLQHVKSFLQCAYGQLYLVAARL